MKIVIRRHIAEYQVFRAIAVAQAAAAAAGAGSEVFIECLDKFKNILALAPSIKWKNPHHPYKVAARDTKGPDGSSRPAAALYDEVIDIDSDGPLELQWMKSGLPWWPYTAARVKTQSAFGAKLTIADFPTIEAAPDPWRPPAPNYIILAALSVIADPRQINTNKLEAYAKKLFPNAAVYWISPDNSFLGDNRFLATYDGFTSLAGILAGAQAVFAVNGLVSAMAQSTFGGKRLVRRYCHVRGTFENASKDLFLKMAAGIETDTSRGEGETPCGVVTTDFASGTNEIKEIVPLPLD